MYEIKGKNVLVTGGSGGIGLAFAKEFAREGVNHIVIVSRDKDKLLEAKEEIQAVQPVKVSIFTHDLSDDKERKKMIKNLEKENIKIDILCNNAGFGKMTDFAHGDIDMFQNMIDLNVKAVVGLTHHFLQDMLKNGTGGIINVASVAGFQSLPFYNIYAASKAFVLSFTEALYGEYTEDGLRIFAFCPAETNTDRMKRAGAKIKSSKDFDSPEEIVKKGIEAFKKGDMTMVPNLKKSFYHRIFMRLLPRKIIVNRVAKKYHHYKKK